MGATEPDSVIDDLRAVAESMREAEPAEPAATTTETAPSIRQNGAERPAPDAEGPAAEAKPVAPEGRDEKGRFAPKAKGTATPTPIADLTAKSPQAQSQHIAPTPVAPRETPAAPPAEALKAPPNWKPAAREHWGTLPPSVQQEAIRVDREVRQVLQESAEARKRDQAWQQIVAPYEAMIRAEGGDPQSAAAGFFQTAAALRTAPGGHKAQIVANIIRTYGVPIDALDAELSGQGQPQGQQPAQHQQQQQTRDPEVVALLNEIKQGKQLQQQRYAKEAQSEVDTFKSSGKAEFFDDVSKDVLRIMRMADEDGVAMTLEEAYNRAVRMNPDTFELVQQRAAAEKARNANASTQRTRNAASSVKSQPAGGKPPVSNGSGTVMDDLLEAAEQLRGR